MYFLLEKVVLSERGDGHVWGRQGIIPGVDTLEGAMNKITPHDRPERFSPHRANYIEFRYQNEDYRITRIGEIFTLYKEQVKSS